MKKELTERELFDKLVTCMKKLQKAWKDLKDGGWFEGLFSGKIQMLEAEKVEILTELRDRFNVDTPRQLPAPAEMGSRNLVRFEDWFERMRKEPEPRQLKLFVRWNGDGTGFHRIELEENGQVVQIGQPGYDGNREYTYCRCVVVTLKRLGYQIEMPQCLTGKNAPDFNRQD